MSDRMISGGGQVPADDSHKEIDPRTGQQRGYVVLTPEERAKGFVNPVRTSYVHDCGEVTTMSRDIAETYARDPWFYSGTFCCRCCAHFSLEQFHWIDGEPMDPLEWPEPVFERVRKAEAERKVSGTGEKP